MSPPIDCLANVLSCFDEFQNVCWKNRGDAVAYRALGRLHEPVKALASSAIAEMIQEMKNCLDDPHVQTSGMHILRAVVRDNEYSKRLVLDNGVIEVVVQGMQHHPTNEALLIEALEAIDEIHGLESLLQALHHLKGSVPGVRAALWAFSDAAKKRWSELQKLPAQPLVQTLLAAVDAHKDDYRILLGGLEFMGDLTLDGPHTRGPFAVAGGWDWLLSVLESHMAQTHIVLQGCKIMSSLAAGGSWADAYAGRSTAVLERALCQHDDNECVTYWALWAIQRLNGARALVVPMCRGTFRKPSSAVNALRCLSSVSLGQSDGASVRDMPALIDAVVQMMSGFTDHCDVMYEGVVVLGHAASFVVGANHFDTSAGLGEEERRRLVESAQAAVGALLQLIQARIADAETVKAACESLAQIIEASSPSSPLRSTICRSLFQGDEQGGAGSERLLSRVMAAHVSNDALQTTVMWLTGLVHGVLTVVERMRQHISSFSVQMSGIRTLGLLYGDRIDLEQDDLQALSAAIGAVTAAMAYFKQNIILQQHGCYALGALAEHGGDAASSIAEDVLLQCITAVVEALSLIRGRCDSMSAPASYNALYLRKESTRCLVSICGTWPALGRWLRDRGLQEVLADALTSTAESVWDGSRDKEAEETLRLELLALSYVLGPPVAILEPLHRWGSSKPAVARAAADAVVELARKSPCNAASLDTSDAVSASVALPVQALHAAGCGAKLLGALEAHVADEDLVGRIHLAVGFVMSPAASQPA